MRLFFLYFILCQAAFADSVETYFIGPAANQAKANNVVSLQSGETLRWVGGSGAVGANSGTFSYSVSYTNSSYSYIGTTSLSEGTFLATGPCSVTFAISSQMGATNAYTITVLRQIAATNNAASQLSPSTAVVIPSDSGGPVTILLESSPDLLNWYPSMPGQYGASYTNRFFRVRAILNN